MDAHECYDSDQSMIIQVMYVYLIVIYVILTIFLGLWSTSAWFVLIIPFIVFGIGIWYANELNRYVEREFFKISYLSVGLVLTLPLLAWMSKDFKGDHTQFVSIIVVSMITTLLSMVEIWFPERLMSAYKHWRSGLQTISITFIIYALLLYYLYRSSGPLQ